MAQNHCCTAHYYSISALYRGRACMQADAQHCQDILSILTQLSQSVSQSGPFVHSLACLSSSWLTATIRFARQQQNATR